MNNTMNNTSTIIALLLATNLLGCDVEPKQPAFEVIGMPSLRALGLEEFEGVVEPQDSTTVHSPLVLQPEHLDVKADGLGSGPTDGLYEANNGRVLLDTCGITEPADPEAERTPIVFEVSDVTAESYEEAIWAYQAGELRPITGASPNTEPEGATWRLGCDRAGPVAATCNGARLWDLRPWGFDILVSDERSEIQIWSGADGGFRTVLAQHELSCDGEDCGMLLEVGLYKKWPCQTLANLEASPFTL